MTMIDGRTNGLAHVTAGSGPMVLFLHGIGSSRRSFDAQVAGLGHRYRAVAVDAPGYGDSDDPDPDPRTDPALDLMDWYAEQFEQLLPADRPSAVVGVSFGGVVAARMAMRSQRPLGALVLADTSRGSGVNPAKAAAMRERPGQLAKQGEEQFAAQRSPRLLSPRAPVQLVQRVADNMARSIRLPGYAIAAEAMAGTDHGNRLGAITTPTLVVVGAADVACPPSEAEAIADAIADADLQIIDGAGHLANLEKPDTFNRAVASHLDRHLLPQFDHSTTRQGERQ